MAGAWEQAFGPLPAVGGVPGLLSLVKNEMVGESRGPTQGAGDLGERIRASAPLAHVAAADPFSCIVTGPPGSAHSCLVAPSIGRTSPSTSSTASDGASVHAQPQAQRQPERYATRPSHAPEIRLHGRPAPSPGPGGQTTVDVKLPLPGGVASLGGASPRARLHGPLLFVMRHVEKDNAHKKGKKRARKSDASATSVHGDEFAKPGFYPVIILADPPMMFLPGRLPWDYAINYRGTNRNLRYRTSRQCEDGVGRRDQPLSPEQAELVAEEQRNDTYNTAIFGPILPLDLFQYPDATISDDRQRAFTLFFQNIVHHQVGPLCHWPYAAAVTRPSSLHCWEHTLRGMASANGLEFRCDPCNDLFLYHPDAEVHLLEQVGVSGS